MQALTAGGGAQAPVSPPQALQKQATLVVLEGTDGSGKTTAALRLVTELQKLGLPVSWHPNRTFRPVREALNAVAREEGFQDRFDMLGRDFGQLIPSVLKWREMLAVEEDLGRPGHWVVIDRYIYAQFALARTYDTGNEPLLRRLYRIFPAPDAVFFLDLDPATAGERVRRRGVDSNSREFLQRFRTAFQGLPEYPDFTLVDAGRGPDEVFVDIWSGLRELLPAPGRHPEAGGGRP